MEIVKGEKLPGDTRATEDNSSLGNDNGACNATSLDGSGQDKKLQERYIYIKEQDQFLDTVTQGVIKPSALNRAHRRDMPDKVS
jgi:hypothetical protein